MTALMEPFAQGERVHSRQSGGSGGGHMATENNSQVVIDAKDVLQTLGGSGLEVQVLKLSKRRQHLTSTGQVERETRFTEAALLLKTKRADLWVGEKQIAALVDALREAGFLDGGEQQ